MKAGVMISLCVLLLNCSNNNNPKEKLPLSENQRSYLSGHWVADDLHSFYTSIDYNDSLATIDTKGDTVIRYFYFIENNNIHFKDYYNKQNLYTDSVLASNDSLLTLSSFIGEKSNHVFRRQYTLQGQWRSVDSSVMYPVIDVQGDHFILYKKDKSNISLNFEQKSNNVLMLMNEKEANIYDTISVLKDSIVVFTSLYHDKKTLRYQKK